MLQIYVQVPVYPESITENVFNIVPQQANHQLVNVNFLERLWGKYIIQYVRKINYDINNHFSTITLFV